MNAVDLKALDTFSNVLFSIDPEYNVGLSKLIFYIQKKLQWFSYKIVYENQYIFVRKTNKQTR